MNGGCLKLLLLGLIGFLATVPPDCKAAVADSIYINGAIWTGESSAASAEALAVRGDKLVAVGSISDIKALTGPETVIIDLGGLRVVPGFHDSHVHFPGPPVNEVLFDGVESLPGFQQRIAAFAHAHPERSWITGEGWTYAMFPGSRPHRKLIDAIEANRPVLLWDRDGHTAFLNTKALELSGIGRTTPDPPNGRIDRDKSGEPTGELHEAAMRLLDGHVPPPTVDDLYDTLVQHMDEAAADGLTSVQNAWWSELEHPAFLRAAAAGTLKLRFRFAAPMLPNEGASPSFSGPKVPLTEQDLALHRRLRDTFRGPLIEFGAVKGFLDGTVDARTAAMFDPYVGGGNGITFWKQDDLNRTVALYDREGFQILLHAIGDKAIHMALDAFEYAESHNGTSGRRHRIEHSEVPALADMPRFRKLGVITSTQALFANPDPTTLGNYAVLLGPERAARANAFRLFDDAGAVQAFGSDWSVFDFAPLKGIYCAVTRMTPEGSPVGGWYPENRITVEAALRHYTIDGAYASFEEKSQGTLATGKLADFVVLSRDILSVPAAQLLDTKVLLTVMGGKVTFRDPDFH